MPKITKILDVENKGIYALVHVLTDEGDEGVCWVGGDCEVFYHHGQIKVFVKRNKAVDKRLTT